MRVAVMLMLSWAGMSFAAGLSDPLVQRSGSWGQPYQDQWGLFAVHAVVTSMTGSVQHQGDRADLQPVIVAVIDTGIDYRHPDLPAEQFWRHPVEQDDGRDNDGNGYVDDLIGWNFIDDSQSPWDNHGHGTHVAGIIAARSDNGRGIAGVAPNVKLMALKALNANGYGRGSDIARAIRYAVDQGARIIHLSLGGESPGVLERQALEYADDNRVLVVVAAGNQAARIADQGYEALPGVMVIGALGADRKRAAFSDWGGRLDLVAPGVDILSLRAMGTDFLQRSGEADYRPGEAIVGRDYYRASGTSFAAPYVTGAAALLLGRYPELAPHTVARILRQSARPLEPAGHTQIYGAGLLDIAAALAQPPGKYISATFSHAEWQPRRGLVLFGQADASQFVSAWLEVGEGLEPLGWRRLPAAVIRQRREGPLAVVPLEQLPAKGWLTLKLMVEHADGSMRHSYLQLWRVASRQAGGGSDDH